MWPRSMASKSLPCHPEGIQATRDSQSRGDARVELEGSQAPLEQLREQVRLRLRQETRPVVASRVVAHQGVAIAGPRQAGLVLLRLGGMRQQLDGLARTVGCPANASTVNMASPS